MKLSVLFATGLVLFASVTTGNACASGARCLSAPEGSEPAFSPGDHLAPGSFNVLMNSGYYGLPRAGDGFWYVTIDRRVLRIKSVTYEVVEDVTAEARRAF